MHAVEFFWLCSSCKPTILKKPQPITNVIIVGANHSHYSVWMTWKKKQTNSQTVEIAVNLNKEGVKAIITVG